MRGNTLVAGQTGNVVFLSVGLIQKECLGCQCKVNDLTCCPYDGCLLLTGFIRKNWELLKKPILSLIPLSSLIHHYWFCSQTVDNIYLVPPLAFCMGLVTTALEKFRVSPIIMLLWQGISNGPCWPLEIISGPSIRLFYVKGLILLALLSSFVLGVVFRLIWRFSIRKRPFLGVPLMMSIFTSTCFCLLEKKGKEKLKFGCFACKKKEICYTWRVDYARSCATARCSSIVSSYSEFHL